jgi:endonuclease/exonuclease/phosphatase family metal-dependent hydrolase
MISPLHGKGRRLFFQTLAVVFVALFAVKMCAARPSVQVATFNIERFPKSDRQVDGAFETIEGLEAGIIAVQEITEPTRFRRAAHRRLTGSWRALFPESPTEMSPGLLVDASRFRVVDTESHDETVVVDGARPVFEVELQDRRGASLEVFVVHLQAYPRGLPNRREQYDALRAILRDHDDADRHTVLLGDFNSTEPQDRELLANTAGHTSLRWLSRRTECTGYWKPDESCRSFALDHVLADGLAARALSRGPCESVGCHPGESCPVFHRQVSDHCPLTVRLVVK